MTKPTAIEHLPERGRFQTVVDGRTCVCDYRLAAGVLGAVEGRGIAAELVAAALAHARANGWKVRPVCSYVQAYMRRHAETQDLLA
ncbi:MAG TPA: N-acetyltransferase [Burkholderiaceae bacterium]|nr:N-acetyltransferase [Burkholderiaceae bacterium]